MEARELAKSARERGDKEAEQHHSKDALTFHAIEGVHNRNRAKLIFDEKNKVRGDSVKMRGRACS